MQADRVHGGRRLLAGAFERRDRVLHVDGPRVADEDRVPAAVVRCGNPCVHDVARDQDGVGRLAAGSRTGRGDVNSLDRLLDQVVEDLDGADGAAGDDDALVGDTTGREVAGARDAHPVAGDVRVRRVDEQDARLQRPDVEAVLLDADAQRLGVASRGEARLARADVPGRVWLRVGAAEDAVGHRHFAAADERDRTVQVLSGGRCLRQPALDPEAADGDLGAVLEHQRGLGRARPDPGRRTRPVDDDTGAIANDERRAERIVARLEAQLAALGGQRRDGCVEVVARRHRDRAGADVDRSFEELLDRLLDRVARAADAGAGEGDVVGVQVARV